MPEILKVPQLMTIEQLAERLEVTERFVRRLIAEGRVPHHKVGKLIRFGEDEIAAWLETTRRPPAMTTAAPEPLRLFADNPGLATDPSHSETTPLAPQEQALRALARSADLLRQAELRFDHAVRDARELGHNWRAIGTASGFPYQSLHRRFSQPNIKTRQYRRSGS
jgi:excisionase family DNA binding protein